MTQTQQSAGFYAGAGSTADSDSYLRGSSEIILGSSAYLIGGSSLNLTAGYDNIDVYAYARSICRCFGGYTHPDATVQMDTTAFVDGEPRRHDLPAHQPLPGRGEPEWGIPRLRRRRLERQPELAQAAHHLGVRDLPAR